jgi:myotubularin-related protein 6/7/8
LHKFDLEAEYARMGLPNKEWNTSTINQNYEICDTYPNLVYTPSSASKAILQASASFRSRGRLPVLSYLHHNGASLSRCSQPLAGFSARCIEDEQLLDCILKTNKKSSFMYIVDTRPKV